MTLLVLAAGMGSRYGGLKQLDPMTEHGEFIIDFSVYDAIRAGYTKVVFVIKEENYDVFRETIGSRIEKVIDVEYVFQKMNVPAGTVTLPAERVKPLGTAHALLATKNAISGKFSVINADDYYGKEAYVEAFNHLMKEQKTSDKVQISMVGFVLGNTLSENGGVTRGICKVDDNNILTDVVETSNIIKTEIGAAVQTDEGEVPV